MDLEVSVWLIPLCHLHFYSVLYLNEGGFHNPRRSEQSIVRGGSLSWRRTHRRLTALGGHPERIERPTMVPSVIRFVAVQLYTCEIIFNHHQSSLNISFNSTEWGGTDKHHSKHHICSLIVFDHLFFLVFSLVYVMSLYKKNMSFRDNFFMFFNLFIIEMNLRFPSTK